MPFYRYSGRDSNGSPVKGKLEGVSTSSIVEQLTRIKVTPLKIEEADVNDDATNLANLDISVLFGGAPVSLDELIVFCRQMYALMKSGVPILRAINGMAESSNSKSLTSALLDIARLLEGGYTLSNAMNRHPKLFPPLFISLIHVGENTGKLDDSFLELASYFSREQETRKRIKTALRYPSFVLAAITAAIVILNIFVVPTFSGMFEKLGADLPLATQMLIASSNFFIHYWPHLLISCVGIYIGLRHYLKTDQGEYQWDKRKINMPIVGSIIERSILSRFSHSFAIVVSAGVPMTTGLSLVADAVDNSFMKDKIITMRGSIESGESLLRSAIASKMFTPLVLQMIAVGEETGRVDELLKDVGDYYEREVDYDLSQLTSKIEPILISVVAAMVLVLALGIFTPMWNMMSALK